MSQILTDHDAPPEALLRAEDAVLQEAGVYVERHDVIVSGQRLHYLTCGAGDPLLLLHGRGNAGAIFTPLFAPLAAQRRVIALDLPGWGLSEKVPFTGRSARDALDYWIASVSGFLDALNLRQVDLLGHSMGGFIALGMGLERAERVHRLVLVNAAGIGDALGMDERLVYWVKPERLLRWFGRTGLRIGLRSELGPKGLPDGAMFDFLLAIMSQPDVIPSGARAFDRWINLTGVHLQFGRRVKELSMPVLLVWGDRDVTTPYSEALLAARALGPGHLVAFTGCGHAPFLQRPDDVARVINAWLSGDRVSTRV